MSIDSYRKKIDGIDQKIIDLLAERFKVAAKIGEIKSKENKNIYDPKREKELLEEVGRLAQKNKIDEEDLKKIFIDIMATSKRKQNKIEPKINISSNQKMKIGFQGIKGAYSEIAIKNIFPQADRIGYETFEEVFDAVLEGTIKAALIPVENSTYGSVIPVYDMLTKKNVIAVGEINMPIIHCLIGLFDASIEEIKEVYSHPQAFGQCKKYLRMKQIKTIEHFDTAGAAKYISELKDKKIGAIASEHAADLYGLKILEKNINDNKNNTTRFLVFVKEGAEFRIESKTRNYKTSMIFSVPHVAGSLYGAIEVLAKQGLNLTKIESRPTGQMNWEYLFYIDFLGSDKDQQVRKALEEMKKKTQYFRMIGSYPAGD